MEWIHDVIMVLVILGATVWIIPFQIRKVFLEALERFQEEISKELETTEFVIEDLDETDESDDDS